MTEADIQTQLARTIYWFEIGVDTVRAKNVSLSLADEVLEFLASAGRLVPPTIQLIFSAKLHVP